MMVVAAVTFIAAGAVLANEDYAFLSILAFAVSTALFIAWGRSQNR